MKKTVLFILSFLFLTSLVWSDVFITELADPNNSTGSRFVELYNNGASAVDLNTGWDLLRWTNENSGPTLPAKELTGTIAAGGFYIVCANQTTFTSTFGFAADQNIGTGGPADSNGDDQIALRDASDTIIDMFGIPGEDGSNTNHEFEDGRAERKATVTTGNTTYTFSEWNIWNDTGGAGTTNDPQDAPGDFDPGEWIGAPVDPEPSNHASSFSATTNEHSQINLTWNDNDGAQVATKFLIVGKTGIGTFYSPSDGTDPSEDTDWSDSNFEIEVSHGVESYSVTDLDAETQYYFRIYPYTNLGSNIDYKINGTIPSGNATTGIEPASPNSGDLYITEVCGDDVDPGGDNGFMEIYNNSDHSISLTNVQARYFNSNNISNATQIVNLSGQIASGEYVIVTQNETNFNSSYTPITADFSGSAFYFNGGDDGCDIYYSTVGILDCFNDNGTSGTAWNWEDANTWERTSILDGGVQTNWTENTTGDGSPGEDNDTPLSVNLSAFYALYIGEIPTLYWTTQTEENNAYWNVYRGTSDNFTTAALLNANNPVPGNGTTTIASDYIYVDILPVVQNANYWYWIEDVSIDGETEVHEPITLYIPFEDTPVTPENYGLQQNYPNPFNPSTSISFTLSEESDVELIIYNVKGAKINTIFNDHIYADQVTTAVWDGNDINGKQVSSGVYLYKLITNTRIYSKKMLMMK